VIIFGSVWFLSKKITKPKFFFFEKKNRNRVKLTSSNWFWLGFLGFGSVFSGFGLVFFGLARFFRFGSVLARFFWFGSVLARFGSVFFRFFVGFGSVRFGFFSFLFIKPKPNRPVFSKI
jgi:hypothetical protein